MFYKKSIAFVAIILLSVMSLVGCNSSFDEEEYAVTIDQFEEALRFNYETSYVIESNAFKRLMKQLVECDVNNSEEVIFLKGTIQGMVDGKVFPIYHRAYDLCEGRHPQPPFIPKKMSDAAWEFSMDYWKYLESMRYLTNEEFLALLKNPEFQSLNKQLQEAIERYIVIEISTDNENLQKLFIESVKTSRELMSQLQEIVEPAKDSGER